MDLDLHLSLYMCFLLQRPPLKSHPPVSHCTPLCRPALKLLTAKTNLSSLKLDFIPWLTRHCLKATTAAAAAGGSGGGSNARARSFGGSGLNPSLSPAELALARHGSGFLLSGATGSGSFSNIAAAATAAAGGLAAAGAAAGAAGSGSAAAAAGSNAGAGSGSSQPGAAAAASGGNVAASSTAGSMAGDLGEGEGADGWAADVGMGLPGVLTGLGLPGEGYMALSHAGGFVGQLWWGFGKLEHPAAGLHLKFVTSHCLQGVDALSIGCRLSTHQQHFSRWACCGLVSCRLGP